MIAFLTDSALTIRYPKAKKDFNPQFTPYIKINTK